MIGPWLRAKAVCICNRDLEPVDAVAEPLALVEQEERSNWIAARVVKIAKMNQPTPEVAPDQIPEGPPLEGLSHRDVTRVFLAAEVLQERQRNGIDRKWHALHRADASGMGLNTAVLKG